MYAVSSQLNSFIQNFVQFFILHEPSGHWGRLHNLDLLSGFYGVYALC